MRRYKKLAEWIDRGSLSSTYLMLESQPQMCDAIHTVRNGVAIIFPWPSWNIGTLAAPPACA